MAGSGSAPAASGTAGAAPAPAASTSQTAAPAAAAVASFPSGVTTSDPEGTRLYPVLVILDATSHQAALEQVTGHVNTEATAAGEQTAGAVPAPAASAAAPAAASDVDARPVPSASAWLLQPNALSTQVMPALAASLAAASAAAAAAASTPASVPVAPLNDVVLLTRAELELNAPKKKGKDASGASKKKKGEEMSAEEQYEAAHYSISRELVELLRERIDAEVAQAQEALIERRRAEIEAADPAFVADPKKAGAKGAAGKKPTNTAVAAAAALAKKPATPGAAAAGASPSKSGSTKKSGTGSGKNSARGSRAASPSHSKPGTPRTGAGGVDSSSSSSGNSGGVRYPAALPVHFVLFDLVRTLGDAQRVQEALQLSLDVFVRLQDPALVEAAAAAQSQAGEADAKEFLYGSPTATTNEDGVALSAVEVRLAREAREDAVARAPVPRPHPHDQTVYGLAAPVAPVDAPAGSLLAALVDAQTQQRNAQSSVAAPSVGNSFRNLVFLPVVLPTPTSAPTLGVSITATPAVGPQSPPVSARALGGKDAAAGGAAAGRDAPGSAVKKRPGTKGAAPEVVAAPTAEQELISRLNQELILSLREFSHSRADFAAWGASASLKSLPVAPAPLSSVDTRLYTHLLRQLPQSTIDISTMLYSMFEQVAVHAPVPSGAAAPSAGAASTPSGADLNDFFAGEKLDEVEAFMSQALARVTFNAKDAASASGGWVDRPSTLHTCASSLGGRHNFDGQQACRSCGVTEAALAIGSPAGISQPFLKYGDDLALRRAEASLALGLPAQADSITLAAEALLADRWPLPGVGRRGMPAHLGEAALAQHGAEATALFARATSNGADAKLTAAVFERALLLLELEEMLLLPAPAFKHTLYAALDPEQAEEQEVRVVPAASGNAAQQTPAVASQRVRERSAGASLFHVAHARAASSTVEAAVGARLRELHAEAKAQARAANSDPSTAGFGQGFGLRDESDAGEDRCKWSLESREYQEELDARVLPQRLLQAMHSPSDSLHTQVRYRPLFDELLVVVASPCPLTRSRTSQWSTFLTPNLSLQAWLAAGPAVQRAPRPRVLHNFSELGHSGKLAHKVETFFPLEQGRLGIVAGQVSDEAHAFVFLEKDGILITLEKVALEELVEAVAAAAPVESKPAVVELQEEDDGGKSSSRPSSRGDGTARTDRDTARKGSAGRERSGSTKKPASSGGNTPNSASTASAKKAAAAPGLKSASSKKKAAQEQKEAEDAAALLAAQQAEAEAAARQVLAAQEAALARLRAPPRLPRESIVLAARLANGARFAVSGARADGSNRATYTARSGLVLEVRGASDEVYLKYPRSVLDGGQAQPLVPARKHGVSAASTDAASASASSQDHPAFTLPPAVAPAFATETFRSVSPSGMVYRAAQDGSAWLLLPNGHVGFRAAGAPANSWVWTDNDGARVGRQAGACEVRLAGIQVAQQYDAESGATVWTRADNVMFISYADGSSLAQHADGTRIYVDELDSSASAVSGGSMSVSAARRRVVVEHPKFPPLTFSHHVRTTLRDASAAEEGESYAAGVSAGVVRQAAVQLEVSFPEDGVTLSKHASTDAVTLHSVTGEDFLSLPQGRVLFIPASFDRSTLPEGFLHGVGLSSLHAQTGAPAEDLAVPKHVYDFDLSYASSGRVVLADEEDNVFRVSCAGLATMELGRERNLLTGAKGSSRDPIPPAYYPLPANPIQPRLFVVRGDGSGYELLHTDQVNAFLTAAAEDPTIRALQPESFMDPAVADPAASRGQNVAVSMKYLKTIVPPPPYVRHPVVPNVVRAAPNGLAAGSSLAILDASDPLEVLRAGAVAARAGAGAAPPALVYRHLIHSTLVTPAQKARAAAERAAFADWQESQREAECAYERDAARGDGGAGAEQERQEAARVQEEVARARANIAARKNNHQSALVQHETAALSEAGSGSGSGTARLRPSTANAHRQPSSQHLLPRPLHEQDEAQRVVEQMVQTLTQPPKTFFQSKGTPVQKQKSSTSVRPSSASRTGTASEANLSNFFAQPAFRRDFLLSTLLQRLTDLAAPYIPGSRSREEEQSAAEKEELWASLDDQARALYQEQFSSQLSLLVSNALEFAALASKFLTLPYNATHRQFSLQADEPFSSLIERAHPSFRLVVDSLAAVLGYQRENEIYVLAVGDDNQFRDNLSALKSKLQELLEGNGSPSPQAPEQQQQQVPTPKQGSSHAQKKAQQRSQLRAAREEKEKEQAEQQQQSTTSPYTGADDEDDDASFDNDAPQYVDEREALTGRSSVAGGDEDDGVDYEAVVATLSAKERARFQATPAYQQYLAREARLKQIPSTYSTQQHASHGASFKYTSPFAPHHPHLPPQPARTSLPAQPAPTTVDVTGAPRRPSNRVHLPASLGPAAASELNQRHLLAELQTGQPRPSPKTASTVKQSWHNSTAPFASFVLQPAQLDLGVLRKGCTYRATATLTNAGAVTGRFQVVQPSSEGRDDLVHLKVLYRPGLVAPGMQRRLEVELYAGRVGALNERIEVRSEQHVFTLPLQAHVLNAADYARFAEAGGVPADALGRSQSVSGVQAPQLHATYERDFPASPQRAAAAGPFHLGSTFTKPSKAGPAFSTNGAPLQSTIPRGHFGQTGEIRLVAQGPTPHAAQTLQKQQARRAAHQQDASEL